MFKFYFYISDFTLFLNSLSGSDEGVEAKSCLKAIECGHMKTWLERIRRDITALDNRRFTDERWANLSKQLIEEEASISRDAKIIASKRALQ